MSEETYGDVAADETPPTDMMDEAPAAEEGGEDAGEAVTATPARSPRRKTAKKRKTAAKPAPRAASKGKRTQKSAPAAPAAAKRPARKTSAKTATAAGKGKARASRKSSKAWSTSKMLKDITARLDLSRRQLTAAMDDLTALVGRQIEAATAPLPRLVKGQWKTPDAIGRLASKLGISGKEKRPARKRAATTKAAAPKTAKAAGKSRATAAVSVSLRKRPARARRKTTT